MTLERGERAVAATALRQVVGDLADLRLEDAKEVNLLIDVGELQVALETLCTQTFEYDVEISATQRETLAGLGVQLGVAVPYLLGDPWADRPS